MNMLIMLVTGQSSSLTIDIHPAIDKPKEGAMRGRLWTIRRQNAWDAATQKRDRMAAAIQRALCQHRFVK